MSWGGQSSVMRSGLPGPQNPKSSTMKTTTWHCSNFPRGPNDQKNWSRSNFLISIEIFDLARKFQSRRLDFPTKNRAAVGGSLENFILARNFQSRSKSRIFLIFGPSGLRQFTTFCDILRHFATFYDNFHSKTSLNVTNCHKGSWKVIY